MQLFCGFVDARSWFQAADWARAAAGCRIYVCFTLIRLCFFVDDLDLGVIDIGSKGLA